MHIKHLIITTTLLLFSSFANADIKLQVEHYSNNYNVVQACEGVIGSKKAGITDCITTINADRKLQAQNPIADLYCHLASLQGAIEMSYPLLKEDRADVNKVYWDAIEVAWGTGTKRGTCIRSFLAKMKDD